MGQSQSHHLDGREKEKTGYRRRVFGSGNKKKQRTVDSLDMPDTQMITELDVDATQRTVLADTRATQNGTMLDVSSTQVAAPINEEETQLIATNETQYLQNMEIEDSHSQDFALQPSSQMQSSCMTNEAELNLNAVVLYAYVME